MLTLSLALRNLQTRITLKMLKNWKKPHPLKRRTTSTSISVSSSILHRKRLMPSQLMMLKPQMMPSKRMEMRRQTTLTTLTRQTQVKKRNRLTKMTKLRT